MFTKQKILEEIKRTASENGGTALGTARFESETGIKPYHWEKFWARFGDAVKETGLVPNQMVSGYADGFVFEKLIGLTRKLGKFPTSKEIAVEKNNDSEFPSVSVFRRLGSKRQLAKKVFEYCQDKDGCDDVATLCSVVLKESNDKNAFSDARGRDMVGEVYLFKSGRYFKVGKTNDIVRRGTEIRIQLPERMTLIHSIKTDDPSGVEAYWHRRFESKRMNGEWFDLNSSDVQAFKSWRRII